MISPIHRYFAVLGLAVAASIAAPRPDASAQRSGPEWTPLAQTTDVGERDVYRLTIAGHDARYSAFRFQAGKRPLVVLRFTGAFASGQTFDEPVRQRLKPGETSEPVRLPGGARGIKWIEVTWREFGPSDESGGLLVTGEKWPLPSWRRFGGDRERERPGFREPERREAARPPAVQPAEACLAHRAFSRRRGWAEQDFACATLPSESGWLFLGDDSGWRDQQLRVRSSGGEVCFQHRRLGSGGVWVDTGWRCASGRDGSDWVPIGDDTGYKNQAIRLRTNIPGVRICARFVHTSDTFGAVDSRFQCSGRGGETEWIALGDDSGWRQQQLKLRLERY